MSYLGKFFRTDDMGFYEELAAEYDGMTRYDERQPKEQAMLQGWIDRYHFRSAVDLACGTGLHAILLAQAGIQMVGADMSPAMLHVAQGHAAASGAAVRWVETAMETAAQQIDGQFDAVLCLGNSLPHLLTAHDLSAAAANFARLLLPNGLLVIQMLNYTRILKEQERIVGIHRRGDTEYIRFYDFLPEALLRFNVLTIYWRNGGEQHAMSRTMLAPHQLSDVTAMLEQHGFTAFEYFGSMLFHPFLPMQSQNLVIAARRGK